MVNVNNPSQYRISIPDNLDCENKTERQGVQCCIQSSYTASAIFPLLPTFDFCFYKSHIELARFLEIFLVYFFNHEINYKHITTLYTKPFNNSTVA